MVQQNSSISYFLSHNPCQRLIKADRKLEDFEKLSSTAVLITSAERIKLTPIFSRSSRKAANTPLESIFPLKRHCKNILFIQKEEQRLNISWLRSLNINKLIASNLPTILCRINSKHILEEIISSFYNKRIVVVQVLLEMKQHRRYTTILSKKTIKDSITNCCSCSSPTSDQAMIYVGWTQEMFVFLCSMLDEHKKCSAPTSDQKQQVFLYLGWTQDILCANAIDQTMNL